MPCAAEEVEQTRKGKWWSLKNCQQGHIVCDLLDATDERTGPDRCKGSVLLVDFCAARTGSSGECIWVLTGPKCRTTLRSTVPSGDHRSKHSTNVAVSTCLRHIRQLARIYHRNRTRTLLAPLRRHAGTLAAV